MRKSAHSTRDSETSHHNVLDMACPARSINRHLLSKLIETNLRLFKVPALSEITSPIPAVDPEFHMLLSFFDKQMHCQRDQ